MYYLLKNFDCEVKLFVAALLWCSAVGVSMCNLWLSAAEKLILTVFPDFFKSTTLNNDKFNKLLIYWLEFTDIITCQSSEVNKRLCRSGFFQGAVFERRIFFITFWVAILSEQLHRGICVLLWLPPPPVTTILKNPTNLTNGTKLTLSSWILGFLYVLYKRYFYRDKPARMKLLKSTYNYLNIKKRVIENFL